MSGAAAGSSPSVQLYPDAVAHGPGAEPSDEWKTSTIAELLEKIAKADSVTERVAEAENLGVLAELYWRASKRSGHAYVSREFERRLRNLVHSPVQKERLGGIAVLTALVRPTNEAYQYRVMRAEFALRALDSDTVVGFCDTETSLAAVSLMRKFAIDNSKPVRRYVEQALDVAFFDFVHNLSRVNATPEYYRARTVRNCMLVSQLAPLFPHCVSKLGTEATVKQIIARLGEDDPVIRRYIVECLVSILSFSAQPKPNSQSMSILPAVVKVVRKYVRRVLHPFEEDPTAVPPAKVAAVQGALSIIGAMLEDDVVRNVVVLANPHHSAQLPSTAPTSSQAAEQQSPGLYDLFMRLVLTFRVCQSCRIQCVVANTLPSLLAAAPDRFCVADHLSLAIDFLTARAINTQLSTAGRGEAVVALARIAAIVGADGVDPFLTKLLKVAGDLLSEILRLDPPQQAEEESRSPATASLPASGTDAMLGSAGMPVVDATSVDTSRRSATTPLQLSGAADEPDAPSEAAVMSINKQTLLEFISSIARATKVNDHRFRQQAGLLLAKMFHIGVSEPLVDALNAVVAIYPAMDTYVQTVLMRRVETVLRGAAENVLEQNRSVEGLFHARSSINTSVGHVSALSFPATPDSGRSGRAGGASDVKYKLELIMDPNLRPDTTGSSGFTNATAQVALSIIAQFPFRSMPALRLAWFANSHVINFLESPKIVNRRLAVRACLNLMRCAVDRDGGPQGKLRDSTNMIVQQIVSVAVVDPSRRVRLTALESLDEQQFLRYLVQKDILPRVALCLQDEDLGIRARALQLVCKLRDLDPAEADPLLRHFVYHLLTVLRMPAAAVSEMRTQATSLLSELIDGGGDFVNLYAHPFAEVLLQCLQWHLENIGDVDTHAVLPVLEAIGNLAGACSTEAFLEPLAGPLVRTLITAVLDVDVTAVQFRLASLEALTKVVQSTALTIKPYNVDPRLLGAMVASLKNEVNGEIRIATLALLGTIGAINPDREDTKYVALPSVHTATTVGRGGAGHYRLHSGVVGAGGGGSGVPYAGTAGSVGVGVTSLDGAGGTVVGVTTPTGAAMPGTAFGGVGTVAGGVTGAGGVARPVASHLASAASEGEQALGPPPLVPNAVRGDDFTWVQAAIGRKVPVWNQPVLKNYSLVNKLDHPFTDSEVYFPSAALDVLLGILGHHSSVTQHLDAVDAIIRLCVVVKNSSKCLYFLKEIVPRMLWNMQPQRESGRIVVDYHLEKLFDYLSDLVKVVKEDYVEFLPDTVSLCHTYLTADHGYHHQPAVTPVTDLLQVLRKEVGDAFRPFAVYLLGPLISALIRDKSEDRHAAAAIVTTLLRFGELLSHYAEIVCPALTHVYEDKKAPRDVRKAALEALGLLMPLYSPLSDIMSSIMHPLVRALATIEKPYAAEGEGDAFPDKALARSAAVALIEVSRGSPAEFVVFVPIVSKALLASGLCRDGQVVWESNYGNNETRRLVRALLESDADVAEGILERCCVDFGRLARDLGEAGLRYGASPREAELAAGNGTGVVADAGQGIGGVAGGVAVNAGDAAAAAGGALPQNVFLAPDAHVLLERFATEPSFQAADWTQWLDSLGVALLGQSGNAAMRAVAQLAERNPVVGRRLFNAAFLSCWPKLEVPGGEVQEQILKIFEEALTSPTISLVVKQALLDLFEFMDHDERPLPIGTEILAKAAVDVGAYAKALRSRETVYLQCQHPEEFQQVLSDKFGLIEVYNNLNHTVSAVGTLRHYESRVGAEHAGQVKQQYNETLRLLPQALDVYRQAKGLCQGAPTLAEVTADSEERGKHLFKDEFHLRRPSQASSVLENYAPQIAADGSLANPLNREELEASGVNIQDYTDLNWFLTLCEMRVLDKLGEWRTMEENVGEAWEETANNSVARVGLATSGRGCSVAFDLSKWDVFQERVATLSEHGGGWDLHFYKSLLCVQESRTNSAKILEASSHVQEARKILDLGLTTRAAEGYPRAYWDFLNAQHLVELDEMIGCIQIGNPPEARNRLQKIWDARLHDARSDQHTWYKLLMIRSLLSRPIDNKERWLSFVTKCRKDNRLPMATEGLRKLVKDLLLLKVNATPEAGNSEAELAQLIAGRPNLACAMQLLGDGAGRVPPVEDWSREALKAIPDTAVQFACLKHLWAADQKVEAFLALEECVAANPVLSTRAPGDIRLHLSPDAANQKNGKLHGEIYLKLAKWSDRVLSMPGGERYTSREASLQYANTATEWNPSWFKAWHTWAAFNADLAEKEVLRLEAEQRRNRRRQRRGPRSFDFESKLPPLPSAVVRQLECAVDGYFRAIKYGGKTTLEDVLTVLKLWFKYGGNDAIGMTSFFNACFETSAPESWLEVVPQIIARLHSTEIKVRHGIESLLIRIGLAHPHAVVYPLTVAAGTPGGSQTQRERRLSAENVLRRMKEEHREIIEQARLVASELNRVAILEHEKWYDRIEEASRLYYSENNTVGMLETLRPLHDLMDTKDPETECERKFRQDFEADLKQADEFGRQVMAANEQDPDVSNNPAEQRRRGELMDRAWLLYFQVFRRLQRAQETMNVLEMESVSPKLQLVENLVLAIPGRYKPGGGDPVTIAGFAPRLEVVQSKQRPRKIEIIDSEGKEHAFLLKGHDDLRQDERVMQVFGLMNAHLAQSEDRTVRLGAELVRYAVVALSSNAGLIELVSNTDTMHTLVKSFREIRKVMPNIEYKVMGRVAPDHEKLPLLQKVDLFEFMLTNTGGRDISRVLWLRSRNSEMWLDRRTNFARTLATTSIAGYIVGLGDRHPSNIMIERDSGKIMHIDFGDCFEVAMRREKFPEKIPFRLTRMLVHALEPCGVEGHFRHMAVGMMKVLRQENTSAALLSMMEAFVYDPLIRQKLLDGAELTELETSEGNGNNQQFSLGITPSGPIAESYSEAQSLSGVLRMERGGDADSDGLEPHGPTPSQASKSQRDMFFGRHENSTSARYRDLVNSRAAEAIDRVQDKLRGTDFDDVEGALTEEEQFARLVDEAQNVEYLCQLFSGYVAQW